VENLLSFQAEQLLSSAFAPAPGCFSNRKPCKKTGIIARKFSQTASRQYCHPGLLDQAQDQPMGLLLITVAFLVRRQYAPGTCHKLSYFE
jgi:hypothetical protein